MADDVPMPAVISRQAATERGLKRYFTGEPCINGHLAEQANPEKARRNKANHKALKRGAVGTHTQAEIEALVRKQKYRCANCGASIRNEYHADHKVPLARGGSNDIGNIEMLCPPCNLRKSAKDPMEWARENGRLV